MFSFKLNKSSLIIGSVIFASQTMAATVSINNPSFEDGFTHWSDNEPSSVSGVAFNGSNSAKISGSTGRLGQDVTVTPNTDYVLKAYVKGSGSIGVNDGSQTYSKGVSGVSNWTLASVNFNSGSNTTVEIYAKYKNSEGRFDLFSLESTGTSTPVTPSTPTNNEEITCEGNLSQTITSATDDGSNDGHGPENTIDGSTSDESRWSSKGTGKTITYDLGKNVLVKELDVVWFKGSSRSSFFDIDTSKDSSSWTSVLTSGSSSSSNASYENHNLSDSTARYVRVTGNGNSSNTWNSIIEMKVNGCTSGDVIVDPGKPTTPTTPSELDPSLPPSGNFELVDWSLGVPVDNDNNGKSDTIKEIELSNGYEHSSYFYTASDGGMVFKAPIDAPKTSTNTSYTRSELREMLRRGDTSIGTQGVNKNNWVFGSTSSSAQSDAAGVNGVLEATLKVDHVTTTGDSSQVGRVIVGQIHANDDEPVRLYYRKLKGHTKGSIYFAHEPRTGSEVYIEMVGSISSTASEPSDGITLGELFSYQIKVVGDKLTVTLIRDGKSNIVKTHDMNGSGYDDSSQYMYFKAGVYNQNNTGDADDYVQATFYKVENSHTGYNP